MKLSPWAIVIMVIILANCFLSAGLMVVVVVVVGSVGIGLGVTILFTSATFNSVTIFYLLVPLLSQEAHD